MAERAAVAVAGDDRVRDLDDLGRIDCHGPVLALIRASAPAFDPGGGAMIPIARRRSTGRRHVGHRHAGGRRGPSLEGIVLNSTHAGRARSGDVPYVRDLDFTYGEAAQVSPLIRRVIASNASVFTFHGTGTYIVGHGKVAIIDAGPDLAEHVDAVLAAVEGETVTHLIVTHTHIDHSPATRHIKAATGAESYGFGPHGGGEGPAVEEGADRDFVPDHRLDDGAVIAGCGWTLEAVHTPGHTSNHLCFALREEQALFSGDHVMGWSTTVVSPPDGDMGAYMASLDKLKARDETTYWPTHGPPITAPRRFVGKLLGHRRRREGEILAAVTEGADSIPELVERLYVGLDRRLHPAAARTVLAHLIHLVESGRVVCTGVPDEQARYRAA